MRAPRVAAAGVTLVLMLSACSTGNDRAARPATSSRPSAPAPTPGDSAEPSAPPPSTSPSPAPPPTSVPSPTSTRTRPPAVPIAGLPEQGVAIEHGDGVDLYGLFDGRLVAHLDGYTIYDPTALPSKLVLERDGTYYELEEFERRLRPLASEHAAARLTGRDMRGIDLPVPMSGGRPLAGHWRYEANDPHYSDRVLAQWSGECEVPTAFFVDRDEGDVEPVTGEEDPADAPESFGLGWTIRGQAVVFLPQGACGTSADAPGVYLYRDAGKGRLLVPTRDRSFARMWGNTVAG